ncbi:hypothetical protein VTI28DRAFT_2085 [Corynascus sepedonium]
MGHLRTVTSAGEMASVPKHERSTQNLSPEQIAFSVLSGGVWLLLLPTLKDPSNSFHPPFEKTRATVVARHRLLTGWGGICA